MPTKAPVDIKDHNREEWIKWFSKVLTIDNMVEALLGSDAILVTDNGDRTVTLSIKTGDKGDITASGGAGNTWTIDNGVVTLAKCTASFKADLGLSGTNTGDQTITLTGNVTGSGTGTFAATIANGAVTLAKQADLAANSIIGNNTGSAAAPLALSVSQVRTLLALATTDAPTFLSLFLSGIKSGATQAGAGAAANELWKTTGHATLPDNVVMIGV